VICKEIKKLATTKFPFNDDIFDDEPGENFVGNPKVLILMVFSPPCIIDVTESYFRTGIMMSFASQAVMIDYSCGSSIIKLKRKRCAPFGRN